MITGEQKPISEIKEMLSPYKKILILGCGTCVTVCFAGGEKEVGILASTLRIANKLDKKDVEILEMTVERQCDREFLEKIELSDVDAILSLACGAGVQTVAETFDDIPVLPGLNTKFIGRNEEQGVWSERCLACGNCILDKTGGICPIARCSKNLLNGPCGGSSNGKCEISKDIDCAWQLIYNRLEKLGKLESLEEIIPLKDWSTSRDGGPRKIVREDLRL
jgi:ferredoxin